MQRDNFFQFSFFKSQFNFRLVARLLGMLLVIMSVSMVLPVAVSLHYSDGAQFGLGLSALLMFMVGLLLRNFLGVGSNYAIDARGSFWITAVIWLAVPLMGALPYLFTSSVTTFTDAAFESFSGFTTTGSSVLTRLDATPPGLLVWRSTSQWVGGLGLILFVVALLRRLNEGNARLYESEFSGTLQRRLHPHMARNVVLMWAVYAGLTALLFILLMLDGNGFVDSWCTALSTVSTGGFMTHSDGLASFSTFSMSCITLFMFLAGVNLAVIYGLLTGRWRLLRSDEELHRYLLIFSLAVAISFVSFSVYGGKLTAYNLRFAVFHVASTLSTCGFYTTPPESWPMVVSALTFLLIFIGASAGSTGGGIKIKRLMILSRSVHNYFVGMVHPRAVMAVKVSGQVVETEYVSKIYSFIFLYLLFVVVGAFVLVLCGLDIPNALCMAAANVGNLGPSPVLHSIGASMDYVLLSPVAKWTMMVMMLAGRLEIFALVAVFMPIYWKRR